MKRHETKPCPAPRAPADARPAQLWFAPVDSTAFTSAVLVTALALSMPAIVTYAELKREKQALHHANVQKQAFMSACKENFKTAYCDTIWRTAENLPPRR